LPRGDNLFPPFFPYFSKLLNSIDDTQFNIVTDLKKN
jgi:hypothetical protein